MASIAPTRVMWYTIIMHTNNGDHSDLSAILDSSHENKWVAIASDYSRVIAAADSLRDLLRSVSDTTAIFCKVLPHDVSFAPSASLGA
jgi:hypothetical protein